MRNLIVNFNGNITKDEFNTDEELMEILKKDALSMRVDFNTEESHKKFMETYLIDGKNIDTKTIDRVFMNSNKIINSIISENNAEGFMNSVISHGI